MGIEILNLLVVEDDAFQRQTLVKMLRSQGAGTIVEATDGKKALEVLRGAGSKPVDIVICDLNMPEMDGLEFLRHVSEESHKPDVIITSALESKLLSSATRMAEMYGLHLLGTMPKPGTLLLLKELIGRHKQVSKKLQAPEAAKTFSIEEILQGLQANQFEPFFQPQVDLKSGRLVGAEALARWVHPESGVIAPYAFIELMEQHGHMEELTFQILKKSAEACCDFHKKGHIVTVSVNLSLSSLNDVTLADKIIQMVKQAGADPHYIVLEITEKTVKTDSGQAFENLTRLCMNGFVLSIDDYGTGNSSMQQLTHIAFGELKIDPSFVKDCAQDESLRIAVESSIDMAHKLKVRCVAGGVESKVDWETLKSMDCDSAQGYFIAKPMEKSAFDEYMVNFKPIVNPATASASKVQETMRILVIEDDKFARGIIVRILGDLRLTQAMEADSAANALILMGKNAFDLIITDVDMPDMNGLELIQQIRSGKTHARADTRILVVTAFSSAQLMSVALALDINGFLIKPVVPAVLYEKLEKAMSERLRLHSPLAYQSVMTKLPNLPNSEKRKAPVAAPKPTANVTQVIMRELRPGMIIRDHIYAKDGTLMVRSGRVLDSVAINRIRELVSILKSESFTVELPAVPQQPGAIPETPKPGATPEAPKQEAMPATPPEAPKLP